jgi:hypothetical protein
MTTTTSEERTAARGEIRDFARRLVARQKAAAELCVDFVAMMRAEVLAAGPTAESPALDLEIVEAMAQLDVYQKEVGEVVDIHGKVMALGVLVSDRRGELVKRIGEAARAGEAEAMRNCPCPCPKHVAQRKEADAVVADAAKAAAERAKGET